MRLLNSVCKVIADAYSGVPVYIQEVPREFERPSFFVSKITDPKTIKNYFLYQNNPTFQIIYFGERDEANQVLAEPLYEVEDRLEELFLLSLAVPVIPKAGVKEKERFAKIDSFTSNLRINEGAIYCNLILNFTESINHPDHHEIIEEVDITVTEI